MAANKTRVQVRGTVGKSVRFPTETGGTGATIGVDFKLPDGSVPTLQQLAAALVTGSALQDQPGNITPPGGGPVVIWQNIQYVPAPILNPPRYVHAEEEAGEEYYRMAVPGPIGLRGLQGFPGRAADDPEDPMPGPPGAAGVAGAAGPPGVISAVHLWPDDPEDHISIPGSQGPPGNNGSQGAPGIMSTVHLWPDDAEDPGLVPGAAGPAGASGAQGAPGIMSTVHLWPDDPEDPISIPGSQGPPGNNGSQGAPGIISAVHLWPDDPEDSISIPGAPGAAGTAGAQGAPGAISAVHLWPDDPEDQMHFMGERGNVGATGPAGPAGSSSAGVGWAAYLDQDSFEDRNDMGADAFGGSTVFNFFRGDRTWSSTLGGAPFTGGLTLAITNTSTTDGDTARSQITAGATLFAMFSANINQSTAIITGGPTGAQGVLRMLGAQPIVFGTNNTYRGQIAADGHWEIGNVAATVNSSSGAAGVQALMEYAGNGATVAVGSLSVGMTASGQSQVLARGAQSLQIGANTSPAAISIDSGGISYKKSPTPTAVNATATLTIAQLLTLIITSTTAAAVTATLPTGTLTDAGIMGGIAPVQTSFDWSVINTGANAFTLAAGTGHTIVGATAVAAATSAAFRTVKTAANTFVTYRLAV